MWTAEHLERASSYAHRYLVRMLAQLQYAHLDEQLADVESCLEDAQGAYLEWIAFEHAAHSQQHDLIVDAAVACDVEGGAGRLRLIHARIVYVGIGVGAQHGSAIAIGAAATTGAAISTSSDDAAAVAQSIQLRVNGALLKATTVNLQIK